MRLTRESRPNAEDVFHVGEELPADDLEDGASTGGDLSPDGAVVDDITARETRARPARRGDAVGTRHPGRWLAGAAITLAAVAIAAIFVSGGGDRPADLASEAGPPTSAQVLNPHDGEGRRAQTQDRQPKREQAARKERAAGDRRNREREASGEQSGSAEAAAGSVPASTDSAPVTTEATYVPLPTTSEGSTGAGTDSSGGGGSDNPAPCEFTFEC